MKALDWDGSGVLEACLSWSGDLWQAMMLLETWRTLEALRKRTF